MTALESLLRLLDAVGDDYLHRSHPTAWPKESKVDLAHDRMRPDDPTAEAVCDPARMALADARRMAWAEVNRARRRPNPRAPQTEFDALMAADAARVLAYAWERWHGRTPVW